METNKKKMNKKIKKNNKKINDELVLEYLFYNAYNSVFFKYLKESKAKCSYNPYSKLFILRGNVLNLILKGKTADAIKQITDYDNSLLFKNIDLYYILYFQLAREWCYKKKKNKVISVVKNNLKVLMKHSKFLKTNIGELLYKMGFDMELDSGKDRRNVAKMVNEILLEMGPKVKNRLERMVKHVKVVTEANINNPNFKKFEFK